MKDNSKILIVLVSVSCIILLIFNTTYFIKELLNLSDKYSVEYDKPNSDEIAAMSDLEKIQIVNKYLLVNSDEFSIENLYNLLSKEYLQQFNNLESFEQYIEETILSNIDVLNDYLNVEKVSENEVGESYQTEYIVNVYTKEEYIKLFNYEDDTRPNVKFKYKVMLIENNEGYFFQLEKEI